MKEEKIAPNKLYYSISEVSTITEVKPYVLRFWEKEFPSLRPKKNRSGNRVYQSKEIELVLKIKKLLYDDGYTIEGARHQLRNGRRSRTATAETNETPCVTDTVAAVKQEIKKLIRLLS